MATLETVQRIEPARLEEPSEAISDTLVELSAATATLGKAMHPKTAANLADLVRVMNTYYSNLIEGHHTRLPKALVRVNCTSRRSRPATRPAWARASAISDG